jgi:GTP-binding protein EngB required for normal cell division
MPTALAPSAGPQEIKGFLVLVAGKLGEYADLDAQWRTQDTSRFGVVRFGAVAVEVSVNAERLDEPFRLAVVGEFNSGKSALINALLGRAGLLTEGVTPTTGAITELWWTDEAESGTVTNGAKKEVFSGAVAEAIRYTDQRTPEGQSITGVGARVVLRVNIPLLRNLVVMDTPGLGSNPTDDEVTTRELGRADAAILTVSARHPGTETTVQLAEKLRILDRKMLVAVTWIDKVSDRQAVLDLVAETFADVADGDPIGFASPTVQRAQQTLAESVDPSAEAVAEAGATLSGDGFDSLRSRIEFELQLGLVRGAQVLKDTGRNLALLGARTGKEAQQAKEDVQSVSAEMTGAEKRVQDVLMPKGSFVAAKIDEIVDLQVGEYMSDLTSAVDLFIDQLRSGGPRLGARVLWSKVSARSRLRLRQELQEDFYSLFPKDRYELMAKRISRSVGDLIQFEWQRTAPLDAGDSQLYDPQKVTDEVTGELAKLAAGRAVEGLAWVGLMFASGGLLFGVVTMDSNAEAVGRTNERIMLTKQLARRRLVVQGPQLTEKLSSQFRKVSDDVRDGLVADARKDAPQQAQHRMDLVKATTRWEAAAADMGRLIDSGGEQARLGAGR